jgi:hypothetical protein
VNFDWQAAEKVSEFVILRSPAVGGTTKDLKILRCAQDDKAFLFGGACPELVEGLRMTFIGSFSAAW